MNAEHRECLTASILRARDDLIKLHEYITSITCSDTSVAALSVRQSLKSSIDSATVASVSLQGVK